MRRRGVFDISASLLEVLEIGHCNKTTLGNRANLPTRSLKRYMDLLLRFNLATQDEFTDSFKVTDKGRNFLEQYMKLKKFIEK